MWARDSGTGRTSNSTGCSEWWWCERPAEGIDLSIFRASSEATPEHGVIAKMERTGDTRLYGRRCPKKMRF